MYKRILLAVDGSQTSKRALREAIKLAAEQSCAEGIIRVCPKPVLLVRGK